MRTDIFDEVEEQVKPKPDIFDDVSGGDVFDQIEKSAKPQTKSFSYDSHQAYLADTANIQKAKGEGPVSVSYKRPWDIEMALDSEPITAIIKLYG